MTVCTPRPPQALEVSKFAVGAGSWRPGAWTLRRAPSPSPDLTERPNLGRFHSDDVDQPWRVVAHREDRLDARIAEWDEIGIGYRTARTNPRRERTHRAGRPGKGLHPPTEQAVLSG